MPAMIRKNDKLTRIATAIMKNKPITQAPKEAQSNGLVANAPTAATRVMQPQ